MQKLNCNSFMRPNVRETWEEQEQRWLAQLARQETRLQVIETTGLRSRSQSCRLATPAPGCLKSPAVADAARGKFSGRDETTSDSTVQAMVGSAQLTDGTDSGAVQPTSKKSKAKPQLMHSM